LDTANKADIPDVIAIATMDNPDGYSHLDVSEYSLYSAPILNLHGLSHDFASIQSVDPPSSCKICSNMLVDPLHPESLHKRLFIRH
jgi:hypothetical protein